MAIDYFGPEVAALVCATFVFVGSVIGGAGASMGKYGVIVGGEVILGLGSSRWSNSVIINLLLAGLLTLGFKLLWRRVRTCFTRIGSMHHILA